MRIALASAVLVLAASSPVLAQTGAISGTVTDSTTGLPLANALVWVHNSSGSFQGKSASTDATGVYTVTGLAAGSYYVRTNMAYWGTLGYVDELYNGAAPGLPCTASCVVTAGTAVTVVAGQTASSISFAVEPGGRISGTISPGDNPVGCSGYGCGYAAMMYDGSGALVGRTGPDYGSPVYTSPALPPGSYYVVSANNVGYIDELYNGAADGIVCEPSCTVTAGVPVQVVVSQTTTGINFTLTVGGRLSGTVTDASTGLPLGSASISVYNAGGTQVTSALSNSTTGGFITSGANPLVDGTYYVKASKSGYADELFNDKPCYPSCAVTTGTPVTIAAGQSSPPAMDFMLEKTRSFTGTVTSTTGTPLGNVTVQVYSSTGTWVTGATSNATTGVYTTTGLAPGSYYLRTSNSQGYVDQLYQNISCATGCTITGGTLATLAAPTSTVDFALAQAARLTGTVRSTTGTPLGSVTVQVYSASGVLVTSATSAPVTGVYTTPFVAQGTYFVRASSSLGYLNQLYQGITCEPVSSCSVTSGTPLALGGGTTTLEFSLVLGGKIAGTVTSAGAPLAGVSVSVVNASGVQVKSATTNGSGVYGTTGLPTGNYFIRTSNVLGYLDELHDNIPCLGCNVTAMGATPVSVTAGGTGDATVSFDLAKGGQITGRVSDPTGLGLGSISVVVVDASGRSINSPQSSLTSSDGRYGTTGLPTGTYFVRVSPPPTTDWIPAVYDALQCAPCRETDGTPVEVTLGAVTPNIDVSLVRGGRISGTVTGGDPQGPLAILVDIIDANRFTVATSLASSQTGVYLSGGLPAGTYFARTKASSVTAQGYMREVYDDVACSGCNPAIGTPITVNLGATTPGIDFVLSQGGRVSGHVTAGGLPLQNMTIEFYSQAGLLASSVFTGGTGDYTLFDGLAAGDYYARTRNALGYLDKLYDVVPACFPTCTPTSGTAIHVPATGVAGNIDFALQAGGRVTGTVRDSATNLPLSGITARVYDTVGAQIASPVTNTAGVYITSAGLPAGDYFVATTNTAGYINKVHPGTVCLGCSPASAGMAVAVAEGATAGGIDFVLDRGGRVAGTVTDSATGTPLKGVTVEVFAPPYLLPAVTATTNLLGRYLTGGALPDGAAYTARTTNSLGYVNERYNDISCIGGCSPEPGGTISITAPQTTPSIDFALDLDGDQDGDGIIGSVDTDKGVASDGFSDLPQGGSTAGAILARNGWTVGITDVSQGGVTVELSGTGSGPVILQVCAAGDAEEVRLDGAGAMAIITCAADTGSTTVRALAAFPYIELLKTAAGITTILDLAPGQAATIGSPAIADPTNLEPVRIRLVDLQEAPIGSFALDPGESAEATQSSGGVVSVTVFSGSVPVTVGDEVVVIGVGESRGFQVCSPLAIESLTASPGLLWPPNHKMTPVTLSPAWSGTCGTATCRVVSVTSNEPEDGLGDGDTDPDWEIGEGLTVKLRAERAAAGTGRTYTVVVVCTDESGNAATKTATVSVPHNR